MAYTPYNPYVNPYQYPMANQPMQTPQPQPTPQPQNNQGLIWVSGEIGAKSYLVAPNSTVMLMDSEQSRFFIKSTDSAGMPTIRTYEYKEYVPSVPQQPVIEQKNLNEQFVTRQEYEELLAKIEDLQKPKTVKKKAEVVENE